MDDGAETLEDSVAMVRMAAEHGTTDLVATPHASPTYRFDPAAIAERISQIQAACDGALRLYTGCDFHLSYDNIQDALAQPRKYTISQKNYLLVEFSDLLIFHNTTEIFGRLLEHGMIPVITHPERNATLQRTPEKLTEWVANGLLLQVTAGSATGHFGKTAEDFAWQLLNKQWVHFIATDAHDLERRPPKMSFAYQLIEERLGKPTADRLCISNPRAVFEGKPFPEQPPILGLSSTEPEEEYEEDTRPGFFKRLLGFR